MGIGISITASLPKKGFFDNTYSKSNLFTGLTKHFEASLPVELQENVFWHHIEGDSLFLQIHPAEEPIEFIFEKSALSFSAKTNSAGPGYHAYLIEILEEIESIIEIKWQWFDEENICGDETDYYKSRDFEALQDNMLSWLQSLANHLAESIDLESMLISMPIGYPLIEDSILTPMGFRTKEWFVDVHKEKIEILRKSGATIFPWWNKGFTDSFWYNCALTKAWVDLPWHTAYDDEERDEYDFVLDCFKKAVEMNPDLVIPQSEIDEINNYLDDEELSPPPLPSGIGFKKRIMKRPLTGAWTITLPGYYYDGIENEGSSVIYWFGDKTIRGGSMTLETKKDRSITTSDIFNNKPDSDDVLEFTKGKIIAWAHIVKNEELDDEFWCLQGEVALNNNLCFITICYENDEDKQWAIDTWKTIEMPDE